MDQRPIRTRPTQLRRWPLFGAPLAVLGCALWTGCSGTTSTQAAGLSPDGGSPEEGGPFDASTASNDASGDVAQVTADGAVDALSADAETVSPVISNLMVVANPNCVLSATITFTTNVPTTSSVLVTNTGDGGAENTFTIAPSTQLATSHTVNVLGMRANSTFDMKVTATDGSSNVAMGTVSLTTEGLPAAIAPVTVVTNDSTKTSPGFTMFTVWTWDGAPANIQDSTAQILALDAHGQVVWYYLPSHPDTGAYPTGPKKLPNGDLAFVTGEKGWTEIDMMGNVVRSYAAAAMGLDSLHHELTLEANNTTYLGLSTELRNISGYPLGGGATTTYAVVGDVIVEFNTDGGVLNRWSDFDMLDPQVEGNTTFFDTPFWNGLYVDAGATKDWTHGNSVIVDPSDNAIVTSSRTQNWVYKFARNDGGMPKVVWKLGQDGDFTLTNRNETFQYGQHGLSILPNGHLMMFDDGNLRPVVDGGSAALHSRAVEFSLDTTNKQATIEWQYQETPPFYSQFLGSAYLLGNGNVLICDGGETANPTGSPNDETNLKFARIMEVTHDATPTKVLEYEIKQPLGSQPSDPTFSGYSVYRATRLPSLY
jgi:arylsulfate sulfotransferase